jgi:hypothetical protein
MAAVAVADADAGADGDAVVQRVLAEQRAQRHAAKLAQKAGRQTRLACGSKCAPSLPCLLSRGSAAQMMFGFAREQHEDIVYEQRWRARLRISTKRQIVSRIASQQQKGRCMPRVSIGGWVACCAGVEVLLDVCCQSG